MMLRTLRVPIGWRALLKQTYNELLADNCLGLAAQLAYYFFLALFPALLFLVAVLSYVPVTNLMDTLLATLGRVAPNDVISILQSQIVKIANDRSGGLLTLGMIGTLWSTSSGITAIIDTLNQAYDIREGRPWWKVRLIALALTVALAVFIVVAMTLVLVGPEVAGRVARSIGLGHAFAVTWTILQWPLVFAMVSFALALIYYYAPDAEQEWIWITPGSLLATTLWLLVSLGFRFYVQHFASYNATYGTIGGAIVLLLWFYVSGLAVLVGAELNAELEHASPYGKNPGEKVAVLKAPIGEHAQAPVDEEDHVRRVVESTAPATLANNCEVDVELSRPRLPEPTARGRATGS